MVVHGSFKSKKHAEEYAKEARKKGYAAITYQKANNKWYVSVFRAITKKIVTKRKKRR